MIQLIASLVSTYLPAEKEEGQGLVEYALIVVLISIAAIVIMGTLGTSIDTIFGDVNDALTGAPAAP
ncbi:MAG: Flp family type IVb pilin [Chloroflexota bacterium]|nr:Flp family type IVb pilin [Chloroflexota bacterium]